MASIKVKHCPFCNHDDVEIDEVDLRRYAVCCPECWCVGPESRESPEEAIRLWNRRPGEGLPAGIQEALNSGDGAYRP